MAFKYLTIYMSLLFLLYNMLLLIMMQKGDGNDQVRATTTVHMKVITNDYESTAVDLGTQDQSNFDKKENNIPYPIIGQLNEDIADYDAEPVESQEARLTRLRESCPACNMGSNSWCKYSLTVQHMIVDDVHKTIFCSIPKCASKAFERILLKSINPELNPSEIITHNRTYHQLHGLRYLDTYTPQEVGYRLNNYFKFLVVRNPLERLVSAYLDKFVKGDPEFLDLYGKRANTLRRMGYMSRYSPVNSPVSFSDLVDIIIKQYENNMLLNQHWDTYENLCETCRIKYDYIAKFETYRKDFQHIVKRFCHGSDCQKYAREKNEAKTTFEDVRKYYEQLTPKQFTAIQKLYGRDMKGFGYEFKLPIHNDHG